MPKKLYAPLSYDGAVASPHHSRYNVKTPGYQSPDGRWTALISQHIYARADVILVAPAE